MLIGDQIILFLEYDLTISCRFQLKIFFFNFEEHKVLKSVSIHHCVYKLFYVLLTAIVP